MKSFAHLLSRRAYLFQNSFFIAIPYRCILRRAIFFNLGYLRSVPDLRVKIRLSTCMGRSRPEVCQFANVSSRLRLTHP